MQSVAWVLLSAHLFFFFILAEKHNYLLKFVNLVIYCLVFQIALLDLCNRLHVMKKSKTTIRDIAGALSVTSSTVSRALNNHPAISEGTKQLVTAMARQMNYKPNRLAAALRNGKSMNIGVIVPMVERSIFAAIIRGIEEVVAQSGYGIIMCQTYDELQYEKRAFDTLFRSQVDGVIASATRSSGNMSLYKSVIEEDIPLILFDRSIDELGVSSVVVDDFKGGYEATRHLIEQGCRKIVHFAGDLDIKIYQERLKGYKAALADEGIKFEPDRVINCPSDIELGRQAAEQIIQGNDIPDAIFSSSDFAALGALQVLKSKFNIPEDIAIVGFANEPFTSFVEPAMTTVNQHGRDMGRLAAKAFLDCVANKKGYVPRQIVLQPELIVRASSKKIN